MLYDYMAEFVVDIFCSSRRRHTMLQGDWSSDVCSSDLDVVEHPRERDEGEGDGVEHQLDAHEHHERVAAHQQADGADAEQQRPQDQVPGRRDVQARGDHAVTSSGSASTSASPPSVGSPMRLRSYTRARASARSLRSATFSARSSWPGSTISSALRERRASTTAPTTAMTSSTDVSSKANTYLVNSASLSTSMS